MDLNFETSLDTFHEIVKTHIIRGNLVPLQRFVDVLKNTLLATDNPEKEIDCLNRLTVVACESAASANLRILKYVISILHEFYDKCNNSTNLSTLLELLKRVFVIGSAALRFSLFSEVHRLIDHTNQSSGNAYVYNWIRHIQVRCSRADIITSNPQTLMVGATHALILQNKAFRPDLPEYIINSTQIKDTDPILNSLCQFSFLQAWYVTADNNCQAQGYTDVYIYKQIRTEEIYLKVFREEEVRLALFPGITMPVLVSSFKEVYRRITNQNFTWNSDWTLLFPKDINQILTSYEI